MSHFIRKQGYIKRQYKKAVGSKSVEKSIGLFYYLKVGENMNIHLGTWIVAIFIINLLILFIVKDIRSTQLKEKKNLGK